MKKEYIIQKYGKTQEERIAKLVEEQRRMFGIKPTIEEIKRDCYNIVYLDLEEEDRICLELVRLNSVIGKLKGCSCEICKNRGHIWTQIKGYIFAKPCSCREEKTID